MGDHRMSIKIQAEFHGKKKTADMYINYFINSDDEIDNRITQFFKKLHAEGMEVYNENMSNYWDEQKEKEERQLLKELQDRYDK